MDNDKAPYTFFKCFFVDTSNFEKSVKADKDIDLSPKKASMVV